MGIDFFFFPRVLLERRLRRSRSGSSTRGGELCRGLVAQATVRPLVVVFLLAATERTTAPRPDSANSSQFSSSSRSRLKNDSAKSFSHGAARLDVQHLQAGLFAMTTDLAAS